MKHAHMFLVLTAALAVGCGKTDKPEAPKPPAPAKVANPVKEGDLTTVTVTPKAEERLLIPPNLAVVGRPAKVPHKRVLPAEVMLIPGRSVVLSAPVTATVSADSQPPVPGATVTAKQTLLTLVPIIAAERLVMSPGERLSLAEAQASLRLREVELKANLAANLADAEGQVTRAQVLYDAAVPALNRAEELVRAKAAGTRVVDEARAAADSAKATLEAAKIRRKVIAETRLDVGKSLEVETIRIPDITIKAPMGGTLRDLRVSPGQQVAAGAPLLEVIDASTVWVRVSVPAGEADQLIAGAKARVLPLNATLRDKAVAAKPVAAPPSANPLAETTDLYFELPNPAGRFTPGERVAVELPLREEIDKLRKEENLTIPWAAVIFDIHGGTWVYENTAPQTFVRRRVEVRRVDGGKAILGAADLKEGAKLVTSGAMELYGVEFGVGK